MKFETTFYVIIFLVAIAAFSIGVAAGIAHWIKGDDNAQEQPQTDTPLPNPCLCSQDALQGQIEVLQSELKALSLELHKVKQATVTTFDFQDENGVQYLLKLHDNYSHAY